MLLMKPLKVEVKDDRICAAKIQDPRITNDVTKPFIHCSNLRSEARDEFTSPACSAVRCAIKDCHELELIRFLIASSSKRVRKEVCELC